MRKFWERVFSFKPVETLETMSPETLDKIMLEAWRREEQNARSKSYATYKASSPSDLLDTARYADAKSRPRETDEG